MEIKKKCLLRQEENQECLVLRKIPEKNAPRTKVGDTEAIWAE